MKSLRFEIAVAVIALSTYVAFAKPPQTARFSGIGTPATPADLGNLAWASGPSGKDLPPGGGTAKEGAAIYKVKCMMCHGVDAMGVKWKPGAFSPIMGVQLAGGNSLPHFKPKPGDVSTMAFFIPWPEPIFNTIAVEMPFYNPGTLNAHEVYSLTAFVLFKNGLIKEDEVMDRESLPKVQMPNRNGFPHTDELYMDMKKRGCIETYGVCRDRGY